jgi:zinc transport system substrate-binding protein
LRRIVLTLIVAAAAGCGGSDEPAGDDRLEVAAAFYPLEFAARRVGGDAVSVSNLTPAGAEPHDVELTARDVERVRSADVVLLLGEGFQPAVEDAAADAEGRTFDALSAVDLEAGEEHAEEDEEEHGEFDPHVWLDPGRATDIARAVADELSAIDPNSSDSYRSNADQLVKRLEALDADFRSGLEDCERREIVVSHDAFGYLAHEYNLEQVGIAGIDPDAEPSPARAAEVADFARDHGVTTIFFEALVPSDIAETIAQEIGVKTAVLDPIEGAPQEGDYFGAMRANLEALREALGCA